MVDPPTGDGSDFKADDNTTPGDPSDGTEIEEPTLTAVPEEVVASLHEDEKLGFGEMTKLHAACGGSQGFLHVGRCQLRRHT